MQRSRFLVFMLLQIESPRVSFCLRGKTCFDSYEKGEEENEGKGEEEMDLVLIEQKMVETLVALASMIRLSVYRDANF